MEKLHYHEITTDTMHSARMVDLLLARVLGERKYMVVTDKSRTDYKAVFWATKAELHYIVDTLENEALSQLNDDYFELLETV